MKKYILLENIRSLNNVWAIFRCADWAWFDKIILTGYTPLPPRKEITKTALWAEEFVLWEYYKSSTQAVDILKKQNIEIISAELTENSIDIYDLNKKDFKGKEWICIVMWNEINGVSDEVINKSDLLVQIPMRWMKESLNVSVAAWIIMYAIN